MTAVAHGRLAAQRWQARYSVRGRLVAPAKGGAT